jgi:hypothetical protein
MSAVSLYYYIQFIRAMYIDEEQESAPVSSSIPLRVALGAAAILVLLIGIFPQQLINLTQKAASEPKTYLYPKAGATDGTEKPEEPRTEMPPSRNR